ncbi:cobaltochelatase CobN [Altererythrobacter atlanticus]|uniref:Aerobic cobaltochelatase subunit CobN n=1 Tax=Croceibacterium atlanticum TaxID=1267766 RepID=A0A0F7KQV7_9SPHN|nr:cobaltochelatase subunit CobN [Croceibacterium atlanticum]AKH42873.1 Aerobic cobaltochelatase subunit CobN [Croceibacterium atlanticum]MBB5731653.1 cobaltochelatase CobN [Croceibacterium atlanticum]
MTQLLRSLLLLFLLLPLPALAQGDADAERVRIGYLFSDGNMPGTLAAFRALVEEHPELADRVDLQILTESSFDETPPEELRRSDVLVFDTMNQQMLDRFNDMHSLDLMGEIASRGTVLGVGVGLQGEEYYSGLGVTWDPMARAYWEHGGPQNQLGLLKLALGRAGVAGLDLPEPQLSLDFGYYYPDGEAGRVFADWDSFRQWQEQRGKRRPGAPRVAVGFFKANYYSGDMGVVDAVIAEIERRGAEAIPVFGYPAAVAFRELLGTADGVRADVALGLSFQFNDAQAALILEEVGIPVINLISLYGRSEADWLGSPTGLSAFEGTFNLASPELAGTVAPTVVGTKEKVRDPLTGLNSVVTRPIGERVEMAVKRGLNYADLARTPNAEKRIAIMYYNYPPGRAGISASYLNVAETLENILRRLHDEGFDIGGEPPSADEILADITTRARNVGSDAPGELAELIELGGVQRLAVEDYRQWLDDLHPDLREKVLADWGDPAEGTLMTQRTDDQVNLIIPALEYGNIRLMPQPSRAWGEDLEKLYHAQNLAPSHQYVAAYGWVRNAFDAHAVVHVGTHGTLEWLDGRDAGLGPDDAPDAMIADLPDAYIYNVDVVGEGLVARRRGMATLVDHMVPPFVRGGLTEQLARLSELLNDHIQNESKNPELAAIYGRQARDAAVELGVAKDLGLDPEADWTDEQLHSVETYLIDLRSQIIPYGLHSFGSVPEQEAIDSTVAAILSIDRSGLPEANEVFGEEMEARIVRSGPRELDGLMLALGGRFVPAGKGGEPIRNPDSYPTGANFYGIDPDKIPKPAAWEMGSKLAQQMLDDHVAQHGRYPEKISFVIWGDETMRHEGVLESQIFYMLGTRPVWNERGQVVDVEVIPHEELGRPRVDIVIASTASGLFGGLTRLLDKAVQEVRVLDEPDNQVRQHYFEIRQALIDNGVDPEDAERMAGVRIFDEPPGTFNLNTSDIVASSGSWDSDAGFANEYIRKMGHAYGNGYWGQPMPDVFALNLSGTEQIVHSNSTMLYGTLDNDDMFMYMGGLSNAVRSLDGEDPELVITDTRDPGKPAMIGLDKFVKREFRSRYVNPTWIKGMQAEGYAGASAMREFVEYLWGWEATTTEIVDDSMWQETYETYVEDSQDLGMGEYFDEHSPYAFQDMTARMIETIRKDYWDADEATRARLVSEYLANVNKHGVNCTDVSCGNGRLLEFVMEEAQRTGVPLPEIEQARTAFENAMGRSIEDAAAELEAFARSNDARAEAQREANRNLVARLPQTVPDVTAAQAEDSSSSARQDGPAPQQAPPSAAAPAENAPADEPELRGQVMSEEDRSTRIETPEPPAMPSISLRDILWPAALFILLLIGWRIRELRVEAGRRGASAAPA